MSLNIQMNISVNFDLDLKFYFVHFIFSETNIASLLCLSQELQKIFGENPCPIIYKIFPHKFDIFGR